MRLVMNHGGEPEDSVRLRLVAAAAIMVAIAAVVAQGVVPAYTAFGSLVLAPVGYWFSHRHRRGSNIGTKVVLAVGLVIAFGTFLQSVGGASSVDDARGPLAVLFLWVQVLHSFDVPRRRDLAFSMVSSVILIAEAGVLSISLTFLFFLIHMRK